MLTTTSPATPPLISTNTGFCWAPVTGAVIGIAQAEQLAHVFKALGDPTRVRLLSLIWVRLRWSDVPTGVMAEA